ncbi:MAG: hypothetical protein QNJ30_03165 [Kiloniellales bacterium]|nr:hypothetical protein [Kiloniellales bacterium]
MNAPAKPAIVLRGLAAAAALAVGLAGQVALASEGGGSEGGGSQGGAGEADGEETRDSGPYFLGREADRAPPGFTNLVRATAAFQGYSLFLSPEEGTARFLFDLTYGPLIELVTALSFQQQFGPPRESQAAPRQSDKTASKPSGFVQLGEGLSMIERIQISEKLAGILGRKDALYAEEDGGLPYWIFKEDSGTNSNGASEPAPPRIIWEVEAAAGDAAKGAGKAKLSDGMDSAAKSKAKAGRDFDRKALDYLDENYLWLQERFGSKDPEIRARKAKMAEEKIEELKKKRQNRGR